MSSDYTTINKKAQAERLAKEAKALEKPKKLKKEDK